MVRTLYLILLGAAAMLLGGTSASVTSNDGKPSISSGEPISVEASTVGRFAEGHSWHVKISPSGEAELLIDTYPDQTRRTFKVSHKQMDELKQALRKERFFQLRDEYGEDAIDGSCSKVAVTWGKLVHTVEIRFLMNWVDSDPAKLKEPARALRVFEIIRGWFDDPQAVDLRRYDRMVLDAAQ